MELLEFVNCIKNDKNFLVEKYSEDEIFCRSKFSKNVSKYVRIRSKITPYMALVAGAIVGDGHLQINNSGGPSIELEMTDARIINYLSGAFRSEFGINPSLKVLKERSDSSKLRNSSFRIRVCNTIILSLFNRVFDIPVGNKTKNVMVPSVLKKNTDLLKYFFVGLFLADGGRKGRSISFTTTSQTLFEGIKDFLNQIGFVFRTKRWQHSNGTRVFDIVIGRKSEINKFIETFPILRIKLAGVG